jgi:hypothetical protein
VAELDSERARFKAQDAARKQRARERQAAVMAQFTAQQGRAADKWAAEIGAADAQDAPELSAAECVPLPSSLGLWRSSCALSWCLCRTDTHTLSLSLRSTGTDPERRTSEPN